MSEKFLGNKDSVITRHADKAEDPQWKINENDLAKLLSPEEVVLKDTKKIELK